MSQEQKNSIEQEETSVTYLMKKVMGMAYRLTFYGLIAYVAYNFFSFTPFQQALLILLGLIVEYLRNALNILEEIKDLIGLFGFTNLNVGDMDEDFYDEDELDFVDEE